MSRIRDSHIYLNVYRITFTFKMSLTWSLVGRFLMFYFLLLGFLSTICYYCGYMNYMEFKLFTCVSQYIIIWKVLMGIKHLKTIMPPHIYVHIGISY